MSANEAQWLVTGFLNLAGRVALIAMLAGGADLLLRKRGAALKALVWTVALASILAVIAVGMFSSPSLHPPIRFKEMSADGLPGAVFRVDWPRAGTGFPEMTVEGSMDLEPRLRVADKSLPSAAETSPTVPPRDVSPEPNVAADDNDTSKSLAGPPDHNILAGANEVKSASAVTSTLKANSIPWQIAGWVVVALAFLAVLLLARVVIGTLGLKRLILKWRAQKPPGSLIQTLAELKEALRIRRSVRLLISPRKDTPISFGLFRPTIILPAGLVENVELDGVRPVLAHELGHIRRHDSLVILLQRICLALCFWHPLVHVAGRRVRVLIEDACDDYVLRITGAPDEYASSLTQLAEQNCCRIAGVAAWLGRRRRRLRLEKRIQRILDSRRPIGRVTTTAFLATVAVAVGVSLAASRMPLFGIATEDTTPWTGQISSETQNLKPAKGETPQQYALRMLDQGHATLAIEALQQSVAAATDAATSRKLRYELASIYQLLVKEKELEHTARELCAGLPDDIKEIGKFADFCIASRQEKLAREAVDRLQKMNPEKKVYYASKLYGAFPTREELWFPFQPKALEKTPVRIGSRDAVMYREQLTSARARVVQVADLDGDGVPEVIVAARSRTKPAWIRLFSQAGDLLWKDEVEEAEWHDDILVFDLDGDGKLEIIATGLTMTAYDCKGTMLWQRPCAGPEHGHGLRRTRIIRSSKGRFRIISGVDNRMACLSPDGNVEWEKTGVLGDSFVTADFNGDGWEEILTMKMARAELAAFDQEGQEILTTSTDLNLSSPRLAAEDLNGDGKPEIIGWGGGQKLLVCGMDGKAIWKARSRKGPVYDIGDLDGDGKKEIVCVTPSEEIGVLNHDGSTRFELAIPTIALQAVDIDGDGREEILAESRSRPGRYLFCIGHDGQLRWRFPLPHGHSYGFHAMAASGAGRQGMVATPGHPLTVLSAHGEVLSITPMALYPDALAADLDGDGAKEVLADVPLLRAYDLRRNKALWSGMASQSSIMDSGAIAIDVDGDGAEELVFPCRGYVCVVNGKGQLIYAKYVGEFGEPVFGRIDLEGDGKNEILLCGNRRFLVLDGEGEVIAAASHRDFAVHRRSYFAPHKVTLAADVNSRAGDEILTCVDGGGVTAYSAKGDVILQFRRPPWLPVHPKYNELFCLWTPQIFPPTDINGDGKKELVARIDRLFVWDLQGRLLQIGLKDFPDRPYVAFTRLKRKLGAAIAYFFDRRAVESFFDYVGKTEDKPLTELQTAALPVRIGQRTQFVIFGEEGIKSQRADGNISWRIPAERPRERPRRDADFGGISGDYGSVRRIGLGLFDRDRAKEVISLKIWYASDGKAHARLDAHTLRGERAWRWEPEFALHEPLYEDLDGDGFMEIALSLRSAIAIVDFTSR